MNEVVNKRTDSPNETEKSDISKLLPTIIGLLTIIGFFFAAFIFIDNRYVQKDFMKEEPYRRTIGLEQIPIGAVVPFFLKPDEIKKLSPEWVPANGQVVNGVKLPDLAGRFILGAESTSDVIPESINENVGGGTNISISGKTTSMKYTSHLRGRRSQGPADGSFVIDTEKDELEIAKHEHEVTVSGIVPLPPYRKLVYMVRIE